jgi:hypothetical protein
MEVYDTFIFYLSGSGSVDHSQRPVEDKARLTNLKSQFKTAGSYSSAN